MFFRLSKWECCYTRMSNTPMSYFNITKTKSYIGIDFHIHILGVYIIVSRNDKA